MSSVFPMEVASQCWVTLGLSLLHSYKYTHTLSLSLALATLFRPNSFYKDLLTGQMLLFMNPNSFFSKYTQLVLFSITSHNANVSSLQFPDSILANKHSILCVAAKYFCVSIASLASVSSV